MLLLLLLKKKRFRALPDAQMQMFDDYLNSGRPIVGIRTATHSFNFVKKKNNNEEGGGGTFKFLW